MKCPRCHGTNVDEAKFCSRCGAEFGPSTSGAAKRKWPVFRFVVGFAAFMAIFYVASIMPFFKSGVWPWYLRANAQVAGSILGGLGQPIAVMDRTIASPKGSLLIERGCDAIEPSALFLSAVLASPVPWLAKLWGGLAGTTLLMVLNLARIVSLYFIRVHYPQIFQFMHVEAWQAFFIFFAVFCWVTWARWATRYGRKRARPSTQARA